MIGQRYPGICGMALHDERLMGGHHRVEYRWQGKEYATVVDAESREEAEAEFRRENPHVEVVQK